MTEQEVLGDECLAVADGRTGEAEQKQQVLEHRWTSCRSTTQSSRLTFCTLTRTSMTISIVLFMTTSGCWWGGRSTQCPEGGPHLGREELRLLPGGEVVAPVDLVEVDEVGVRPLGPAPRRLIHLAGKDAHGSRNGDALDV